MAKKKLSIGSWAYIFNQEVPTNDFHVILHKLHDLGYDGVELGGFKPHPGPGTHDKKARQKLRQEVADHGLAFSGLAADLWSQKLLSVEDSGPFVAEFAKNVFFAEDLGIDTIRVDTVEDVNKFQATGTDLKVAFDRAVKAFDLCSKLAADRGMKICWEFEPGFPFNKPSEIIALVDAVRDRGNPNFGVLYDTCHAHMCAAIGANQIGEKELLPGGALELLHKLAGKITHFHFIDSDGTLNEHNTSTHNPFGTGHLKFDELMPAMLKLSPNEWWTVDLCFWPHAWDVTAASKKFLDQMNAKYAV
jgi:sugar phosphate isomerase/epimerase